MAHRTPIGRAWLCTFVWLAAITPEVCAQVSPPITIREAFADANDDRVPDRIGQTVKVTGVLLSDPVAVSRETMLVNLQDGSGGALLVARQRELLMGRVQRGDVVVASAEVALYRGARELVLHEIGRVGTADLPRPIDVPVSALLGGVHSSELVRVVGTLNVEPDFLSRKSSVILQDGTGQIRVQVWDGIFKQREFLDRFRHGGQVEIVGVSRMFGDKPPEYRLVPRDAADFRFAPIPPYREIALAAGFLALLALAVVAIWRRRHADLRAQEYDAAAKRAAEERDRFFTLSLDMLCIASTDGYFKRLNPAFAHTLGWSIEQLLAQPFLEFVHSADRPATLAAMAKLVAGDSITSFENRYQCRSGEWRVLSWRAVSQPGEAIYATARDVTEQRNAEAALRALNEELEQRVVARAAEVQQALATLDVTDDGAFIFDPETLRFTYVNEGAVRLLGHTKEELLALTPLDIESEQDAARFRELLGPMLRGELRLRQITKNLRHKDGRDFPVEINLQYVAPAGERPRFIIMARDVTERRKSESQSRRSQRLEALGTLAGGIAHDLNNALTPVLMAIGMLKSQFPADGQMIDTLQSSAERGAEMVQQLLTFAKGADGNHTVIQPQHLLKEIHQITKFTFPKNIRVELRCGDNLPSVRGDITQLHQVLLNLCVNARDAMPDGGIITLDAQPVEVDVATGAIPQAKPGSYVVLRVSDTGAGIPAEVLDRIFDPFFTTKSPDKGTGLGLSTVLGIMKGHGGFMLVYSHVGQGSTFSAFLPAIEVNVAALRGTRPGFEFHGNHERILIVDDEPAVRDSALLVLRRLKFTPLVAIDGADGIVQAAQHRTSLRAVITDLHMPNVDGLSLVRTLRRTCPEIPVVVTSGCMEEKEREECQLLGVHAFLAKPFTEGQLASALKSILAKDSQAVSDEAVYGVAPSPAAQIRGARNQNDAI